MAKLGHASLSEHPLVGPERMKINDWETEEGTSGLPMYVIQPLFDVKHQNRLLPYPYHKNITVLQAVVLLSKGDFFYYWSLLQASVCSYELYNFYLNFVYYYHSLHPV